MRILHACKYFFPRITGVTSYVENLAYQQVSGGHEVAVATWGDEAGSKMHRGVPVLRARPGDVASLVRLTRDFLPDVVHAHSIWDATHLAVAAARTMGRPYVVTTHGTWHFLRHTGAYDQWRNWLRLGVWQRHFVWPKLLRQAGGVIALNAQEESDARKAGVSRDRLHRIPNAVDVEQFQPGDILSARQALGWPSIFTVLFVGAMQTQKGLFTVLEAAGQPEAGEHLRWVLCGEGPDMDQARDMVEAAGLLGRIEFLGKVSRERMPDLYRAADVVVLPSHGEPFGTVYLEAMASGRPCIGCNDGGTPDIIVEGKTGFMIPPSDAFALKEKVSILAGNAGRTQAMGMAGRERAVRNFSWPEVAGRIEEAYQRALFLVLLASVLFPLLLAGRPALAVTPLDILTPSLTPPTPSIRQDNPVFDGKCIRLRLARGESTAFQMPVYPHDFPSETDNGSGFQEVSLGVRLDRSVAVTMYRVWSIWGAPEVAVPMEPGQPRPFPSIAGASQSSSMPWLGIVELEASRQAAAGVFHGEVTVHRPGGSTTIPLEVTLLPFALPERPSFVVEMNSYGDYLRLLPSNPAMLLSIHRLFHRYRSTFTLVPYRQDGTFLMDFLAPALNGEQPDFTAFDQALAGLFDGSAFQDGQPVSHFLLPFHAGWPLSGDPASSGAEASVVSVRRAFANHIRDKGWRATRFQEFHNENPEHGAQVPWRLDEPITEADLEGHLLFLGYRETACREWAGDCPLNYRIDISRWRPLVPGLNRLGEAITDWSISAAPSFLNDKTVEFFRALGGKWLLAYGEMDGFLKDGKTSWTSFPSHLAEMYLLGLDGYAQWQVDCWKDRAIPGVPDQAVPLVYSNASGARDFIWPGGAFGVDGPMPSLRLFALREGVNVLDYLYMAGKLHPDKLPQLRERLNSLVGRNAAEWFAFKQELTDLLVR